jgi:hypothetical protein
VKPVDHRPARNSFELCSLGVPEDVDETGGGAKYKERENQLREISGDRCGNQGQTKNNRAHTDPRSASSADNKAGHPGAANRADCAHEQRESDLPIAQMKVIFEGREPRHPAAAHHAKG